MNVKLIVKGKTLEFAVTPEAYNKYINEVSMNNKIAPAKNFLNRVVKEECREDLRALFDLPSAPVQICAAVLEEYTPDLEIEVGK